MAPNSKPAPDSQSGAPQAGAPQAGAPQAGAPKAGARPKLAVFKFASCDGCQLSLLDAEDELLGIADAVEIAFFLEARTQEIEGPYDVGLVEGSVTTQHDAERIREIRQQCRFLVTIGACATSGGIQALRNWADVDTFIGQVYAHPEYINTLRTSTPIGEHVMVDFELRGCPINKHQLVELVSSLVHGRKPRVPSYSVCVECKRRQTVCVAVARGIACMGPVTQAGCGAICPDFCRECFGCFGPKEQANLTSLAEHYVQQGRSPRQLVHLTRNFNGYAAEFREVSNRLEQGEF
jgi:sulfhydrogenase subunit delta